MRRAAGAMRRCNIAAARPDAAVAPHALRPIYIRRPDAELARDRVRAQDAARRHDGHRSSRRERQPISPRSIGCSARPSPMPWGADALRWELEHTDVARLYVAEPDGEIVAYCACWMVFDELHINSLAVDEAWRQRGIARRLLVAGARRRGPCGRANVDARSPRIECCRTRAVRRARISRRGVRRDYYQHPRENALVLWHRRLAE